MGISARGQQIAIATAMQESNLYNLKRAVDHDSLGLFQQRPSLRLGLAEGADEPDVRRPRVLPRARALQGRLGLCHLRRPAGAAQCLPERVREAHGRRIAGREGARQALLKNSPRDNARHAEPPAGGRCRCQRERRRRRGRAAAIRRGIA